MNKVVWIGMFLLLIAATGVQADAGLGLSVGYPLYFIDEFGFDSQGIFVGINARWKPSLFLLDAGFAVCLAGGLSYGFLDVGLCFDLLFLRLALAAGFDFVRFSAYGWGSYTDPGINAKVNLDVKLGRVTVGVSGSIPVDMLIGSLNDTMDDDLRLLAVQPTLNVLYWFESSKSHRR
jgi:hypothetical protein